MNEDDIDPLESQLQEAFAESHKTQPAPPEFRQRLQKTRALLTANPPPDCDSAQVLVVPRDVPPYWVELSATTIVGRADDADLKLEHPWVSDRHCAFEKFGDDWQIKDLESTNGVIVNGRELASHTLWQGDAVEIGSYLLIFVEAHRTVE